MDYSNQTPVIFRKWKPRKEVGEEGGDIIALFPTELGTDSPYTCSSYMAIGQHGSADPQGVMGDTVPAKPAEYADLLAELKRIGYNDLKIYQKLQYDFLREREQRLKEIRSPSRLVLPPSVVGPASLKKWAKTRKAKKPYKKSSSPTSLSGLR